MSASMGSSPLTRGKRWPLERRGCGVGLIPAHAGKTRPTRASRLKPEAHPRSRGENQVRGGAILRALGSSPLTRGKQNGEWRAENLEGLIPAHAGKTRRILTEADATKAHPRSRGENGDTLKPETWGAGSSPLTRGKRQR